MSGQITLKMENIREDIEKQFSNLYCKKDFTYQLKIAKSAPSDAKPRAIKKLTEMFRDVGIECEGGRPVSYYERLLPSLTVADTVPPVIVIAFAPGFAFRSSALPPVRLSIALRLYNVPV